MFFVTMAQTLGDAQKDTAARQSAGIVMKNALGAQVCRAPVGRWAPGSEPCRCLQSQQAKMEKAQRWLSLDADAKSQVKAIVRARTLPHACACVVLGLPAESVCVYASAL
jgi:hypothetical protein